MKRQNVTYNQPLEKQIGFSRGSRIGNILAVSGTAPIDKDGSVYCPGDAYKQAQKCLEIIKGVIEQAGGKLSDVIRTRVFLKNMEDFKDVARAHGEFFSEIQPACTFAEVSRFINPEWLVEIEADAIIK